MMGLVKYGSRIDFGSENGVANGEIFIVEDEPLLGELLRRTLSGEPEFDIVGVRKVKNLG